MRLSDYLLGIGEPLYYYPPLARVVGGVKAAVLLCRLIQWYGHQAAEDGGIYKSQTSICDETGMTIEEQMRARKILRANGILIERYARIEHKLFFYIQFDALNVLWDKQSAGSEGAHGKSPFGEIGKPHVPKLGNPISGNGVPPPPLMGKPHLVRNKLTSKLTSKATATTPVEGPAQHPNHPSSPDKQTAAVAALLESKGMEQEQATECAMLFSRERIDEVIETMEWKASRGKCDNPGGFMYGMLTRKWEVPKAVAEAKQKRLIAEGNETAIREQRLREQAAKENLSATEQHIERVVSGMDSDTRASYCRRVIEIYERQQNTTILKMINNQKGDPAKLRLVRAEMAKLFDIDNGRTPKT